jgi:hypothetical protein
MPYVTGYLNIIEQGRPDQGLPGMNRPTDPGYGNPDWANARPGNELPTSPGHPSGGFPISPGHPSQGLPSSPGHPSQGLPTQPGHPSGGFPVFPGGPSNELPSIPGVWPPLSPSNPIVPVPPDLTKPVEPGTIYPPLHSDAKGKYICLVIIPGVGYRYTVIDTSLTSGLPLPEQPAHPSGQPVPGGEHPSGQPVPPQPPTMPAPKK